MLLHCETMAIDFRDLAARLRRAPEISLFVVSLKPHCSLSRDDGIRARRNVRVPNIRYARTFSKRSLMTHFLGTKNLQALGQQG